MLFPSIVLEGTASKAVIMYELLMNSLLDNWDAKSYIKALNSTNELLLVLVQA